MKKNMRHIITALLLLTLPVTAMATESDSLAVDTTQTVNMQTLFAAMPDSLMPYLSHNNRLDLIDFHNSGMTARVTNLFDETTQLIALTDSSLTLQMSRALTVDMRLLPAGGPAASADGTQAVVCLVETFGTPSAGVETHLSYYSTDWQPLSQPPLSDDTRKNIEALKNSTILKWYAEKLNKN